MQPIKPKRAAFICLIVPTLLYAISLLWQDIPPTLKGGIREIQFASGGISYALAACLIISACRPCWLQKIIALDQYYLFHKIIGLVCVLLVLLHFYAKDVGRALLPLIVEPQTTTATIKRATGSGLSLRQVAEISGLYLTYLSALLIVLTFVPSLPYRLWQKTHKLFSLIFLGLLLHACVLTEKYQYVNLLSWWCLVLSLIAIPYALRLLFKGSGSTLLASAPLLSLHVGTRYIKMELQVEPPFLKPGSFVLLKLPQQRDETAHPYTIASTWQNTLTLYVSARGHFAHCLKHLPQTATLQLEGPYGATVLPLAYTSADKIWWLCQGSGMVQLMAILPRLQRAAQSGTINGQIKALCLVHDRYDELLLDLLPQANAIAAHYPQNFSLEVWCTKDKGRFNALQAFQYCKQEHFTAAACCGSTLVKSMARRAFIAQGGNADAFYAEYTAWRSLRPFS